jgi:hypothetical protein
VQGCSLVIGIGIASWLGGSLGIVPVIAIQGVGPMVAGVLVLVALRRTAARDVHPDDDVLVPETEAIPLG